MMSELELQNEVASRLAELERGLEQMEECLDNICDYVAGLEKRLELLEEDLE